MEGKRPIRERTAQVFLEAIKALEVGWFTRDNIYLAMRIDGGGAWDRYREALNK